MISLKGDVPLSTASDAAHHRPELLILMSMTGNNDR